MNEEELIPVRMLNEYVYCPRLAYIEWVECDFDDSVDTLEGKVMHDRVDEEKGEIGEGRASAVYLSAPIAGLIGKIDIVEGKGKKVVVVDYKKGSKPVEIWESDKVQLCAQAIILRENGYECEEGVIYYGGTKERVSVKIDDGLVKKTIEIANSMRVMAKSGKIPKPLVDSPKCNGCSLAAICLPDETNMLLGLEMDFGENGVRMLNPSMQERVSLYVQSEGGRACKKGDVIEVYDIERKLLASAKIMEISQLCIFGNVTITTPLMHELFSQGIPICYFTYGGWFKGIASGMPHKNVALRIGQYSAYHDDKRLLSFARTFVVGKIKNCRTMLRRNIKEDKGNAIESLSKYAEDANEANSIESLLGIEGAAARVYFSQFGGMLNNKDVALFDFNTRNRRPPKDPVNAMLSFLYALLTKTYTITLLSVGFDPYLGYLHKVRYGRPALALDLMEEMRPIICDSVVVTMINKNEIDEDDFIRRAGSCALNDEGRKKVIRAYERRLETTITHPIFGYSVSYRRVLEVQARLFARTITGEIKEYPPFLTR
ncbi:MAG: CRISPR-associated endonuclease Cas1 [Thermoplasmata archaeon]